MIITLNNRNRFFCRKFIGYPIGNMIGSIVREGITLVRNDLIERISFWKFKFGPRNWMNARY